LNGPVGKRSQEDESYWLEGEIYGIENYGLHLFLEAKEE